MQTISIDLSTTAGVKWQFKPENGDWTDIAVPAGGWRAQGYTDDAGSYRTAFPIPASAEGKTIRVAFDAVNFGAEVFAGPNQASLIHVASHVNGWMPFTADITKFVEPGSDCVLVVHVKGRKKYLREGKYIVPQGGTWQEGLADGIIRGISLQILPQVYIDDIFVRTSVEEDTMQTEVVVCNTTDKAVHCVLQSRFWSPHEASEGRLGPVVSATAYEYPTLPDVTVTLHPGERRTVDLGRTGWGLGPESYWWPNVPYKEGYRTVLHGLHIGVQIDSITVHEDFTRFGFREFRVRGAHYTLNGIRCNLRGDNQQEANFGTDAYGIVAGFGEPTEENAGWPQAVDNLQRVNFNVLRIHQVPAVPYMLHVCDEMGLMIVSETPIRGSEGKEDFVAGREHMIAAARELALRDRKHPSVVLWSAANEIWGQRGLALALQAAMLAVDDTRPIIIDGVEDMGPEIINMEHYVGGLGVFPEAGGTPRADRPYGETECVWPMDNSWRGFAWMSTATRLRRLKNNADIRNYVLNNAWSNYVPGQSPETQFLEKLIKDIRWLQVTSGWEIMPPLEDMWNNPLIKLMQRCFHPLTTCDIDFDRENQLSDEEGRWPVVKPTLQAGTSVTRKLAVFNDELRGTDVAVEWEARIGSATGPAHASGRFALQIPLGEYRTRNITFQAPGASGDLVLVLKTYKDGVLRLEDDLLCFQVA